MGFWDAMLGRTRVKPPRVDALFRLSPALVTLQTTFRADRTGYAGVCFRPREDAAFTGTEKEITDLLRINDFGTQFWLRQDPFGYTWVALYDRDMEDLVTLVHMASSVLIDNGYGEQILCAAFEFEAGRQTVYLIYNYKHGNFYPFAPVDQSGQTRDTALELRLKAQLKEELPVEPKLEEWYPLWGIPLRK